MDGEQEFRSVVILGNTPAVEGVSVTMAVVRVLHGLDVLLEAARCQQGVNTALIFVWESE